MKKIITLLSILALIIIACQPGKESNLLLKPDDYPADEYVININKDTTLVTKNGALLKIPKGALSTDKGNTVTLEIKEAYSIEQMIRAGLTTTSNGELLSSGGMIYINAKAGQNVTIKEKIQVATPANYKNADMQLFKGETNTDGNINWNLSDTLPGIKESGNIQRGRQLFNSKCASCHTIGKLSVGPDLSHFLTRYSGDKLLARGYSLHIPPLGAEGGWYIPGTETLRTADSSSRISNEKIDQLLHLPDSILLNQELYFCNLVSMYGSVGTEFLDLNFNAISSIYQYIQSESEKRNLPVPDNKLDDCIDSCFKYRKVIDKLDRERDSIEQKRKGLLKETTPMVEEKRTDWQQGNRDNGVIDDKVRPVSYGSVYYQFTIETFGWFNIDVLIAGQDGVEESELFVRLAGEYRQKVQIYLIIPSVKTYVQGGPADRNKDEFAFLLRNGKINLPQNTHAYILAVSETESSVLFILQSFTTSLKQELTLSLKTATKEEFNAAIASIGGEGLKIGVKDTKNAEEIRQTSKDLKAVNEELKKAEGLRPKNCDCYCIDKDTVSTADLIIDEK